jgi:signal transduction histidine kinase
MRAWLEQRSFVNTSKLPALREPMAERPVRERSGSRQRIWNQLGERNLWGWRFFLYTIPNYIVAYYIINFLPFEVYQGDWVIVGVVSHLVFIPMGLAVRILVPKSAFKHRLAPLLNIVLFALAGLLKNFVEVLLALQLGVLVDPRWLLNLTSGAFGMLYIVLIYVSVFGERVRHLSTMSSLISKREQLIELRNQRQESLKKHEQTLRSQAQELILPRLREFEQLLGKQMKVQEQVDYLKHTLLNTVRPLATQLQDRRSVQYFDGFGRVTTKVRSVAFFERLDLWRDVRPIVVFFAFMPGYINGSILLVGTDKFIQGYPFILITFAALLLVKLAGKIKALANNFVKLSLFLGLPAAGIMTSWLFQIQYADSQQLKVAYLVPVVWGFGLIYIGTAFVTALSAAQKVAERELAENNAALQAEWEIYQRDFWVANKRWSYVLHGEVQAALTTAIARLTMRPIVTALDLAEVREDLERITESLSKPLNAKIDLKSAMDDLVEVWQGVVEISYTGSKEAVDLLDKDDFAKQSISEICKEAAGNAYRHGHATKVEIDLRIVSKRFELTISNDGAAPAEKRSKGIGSKMLDDLAPRWSLTSSRGITTLKARVPSSELH